MTALTVLARKRHGPAAKPEPPIGLALFRLPLSQPHPWAATVLIDELDACALQCPPDRPSHWLLS
jgi:hypothetical protein